MTDRKRRQIVMSVIIAAMVGGFILLRYMPLCGQMYKARGQTADVRLSLSKALLEAEQLKTLQEERNRLNEYVGKYDELVPKQRDVGEFLRQTAALMDAEGLKEQRVEPKEEVVERNFSCIPIDMRCKGRLTQVFNFFKSLQELGRLVRIEDFVLKNDNSFSGIVEMNAKAVIYYRPMNADIQ